MCMSCKGHPSCPCTCSFVKDTDLLLTVFVFRGIPIDRMSCKKCGHEQRPRVGHRVRVKGKPGT